MTAKTASSVPGKAILFGEHAVVYPGHSAIIVPVKSVACETIALPAETAGVIKITDETLGLDCAFAITELEDYLAVAKEDYALYQRTSDISHLRAYKDPVNYLKLIVALAADYTRQQGVTVQPLHLQLRSSIPQGGLGSSAAVAASLFRTFMRQQGLKLTRAAWQELTLAAERFQHGRPSGADVAAVIHKRPVYLTKNQSGRNTTTSLANSSHLTDCLQHCYLIHTGQPEQSTAELIAIVSKQYESDPVLIETIEANTQEFLAAIHAGTLTKAEFIKLVNINGRLLEALGVVSKSVLKVSQRVRAAGGAAKISGAGGLGVGPAGALLICLSDQALLRDLGQHYKIYPII